jgi:hypothetical protein
MEKVKKSPQDDFFGRRLEGSETPFYTVRIHGYWGKGYHLSSTRYLDFPEEIVSAMRLEVGNSVRWKGEGNSLVMTPLPESVITTKLYSGLQYIATSLPVNMMSATGLKRGDYVSLKIEDGCLRVRKTEWAGQDTVKISGSGGVRVQKSLS